MLFWKESFFVGKLHIHSYCIDQRKNVLISQKLCREKNEMVLRRIIYQFGRKTIDGYVYCKYYCINDINVIGKI